MQIGGTRQVIIADDAQQAMQKPVDAPVYVKDPVQPAKPSAQDKKASRFIDMVSDAITGRSASGGFAGRSASDSLQWYHWLIIALVAAGIIYGLYYWYKNRR